MRRRFRGLRARPPADDYDVVVIGAGIGGLVCGGLLAKAGLRVLLIEQHYMAGGYCSTFRRAGFTFDAATHFYPLLGNPRTITGRILADLGVETGWVKMDPVDTFHLPDGSHFRVPADFESYIAKLRRQFPRERLALERFFDLVDQAYRHGLLYFFRGGRADRLGDLLELSVQQVLDQHFEDERLKLLLMADCPHWGSPPSRTSFVFDSMLRLSYFLGNYYPEGGSQAFADELARCFESFGGDILMSTRADRIVVDDGAVAGVEMETLRGRLRGRRTVRAPFVVSNADLNQTLQRLLRGIPMPASYRASVASLAPSFPCFLVHIGLRGVGRAELDRAQGYYWRSWDAEGVGQDALICKIFVPTLYEPSMAPEGCQIVILQKVQELDYDQIEDWSRHKDAMVARMVGQLERAIPGVSDRVVVSTSASAQTSQRFTLNTWGSMLGWEMSPAQLGSSRPGVETPIDGLYLTGHWTRPGGGITPVMVSASRVAKAIVSGKRRAGVHKTPSQRDLERGPARAVAVA